MNTTNRTQDNRYLESPYTMRETSPEGQMPFTVKNPVGGTLRFSKKGFMTQPPAFKDSPHFDKGLRETERGGIPQIEEAIFEPEQLI